LFVRPGWCSGSLSRAAGPVWSGLVHACNVAQCVLCVDVLCVCVDVLCMCVCCVLCVCSINNDVRVCLCVLHMHAPGGKDADGECPNHTYVRYSKWVGHD
jgi:hypothetical protein